MASASVLPARARSELSPTVNEAECAYRLVQSPRFPAALALRSATRRREREGWRSAPVLPRAARRCCRTVVAGGTTAALRTPAGCFGRHGTNRGQADKRASGGNEC